MGKTYGIVLCPEISEYLELALNRVDYLRALERIISRNYDKLVAKLLKSLAPEKRERINYFFNLIRYLETGFGIWQENCIRYQHSVAAQMSKSYRIAITRRAT